MSNSTDCHLIVGKHSHLPETSNARHHSVHNHTVTSRIHASGQLPHLILVPRVPEPLTEHLRAKSASSALPLPRKDDQTKPSHLIEFADTRLCARQRLAICPRCM